ncbi:MAG: hypothetical protein O6943_03355 [Bacteroidetes bacterium]|nr:hypothetical protein [Bacteroidota bacterium]
MKTKFRLNVMKNLFILFLAPLMFVACSTDDEGEVVVPELVITVIDCPVKDIVMTAEVKVTGSTGRWFVNVTVNITCMGEPVNGAEIMVKYGWITLPTKIKTDEEGNAKGKRRVTSHPKPTGKVTVTIEGEDDSKTETIEF